jgi:endo-1,4-beta-xylanase
VHRASFRLSILCVALSAAGCTSDGADSTNGSGGQGTPASGGATGTGGGPSSGGASASSGVTGSGGVSSRGGAPGSGGATGSGGAIGTGGSPGSGGASVSGVGGAPGSGGAPGTGGVKGTGGTTSVPGSGGVGPMAGTTSPGGQTGRGTGGATIPGSAGRTGAGGTGAGGSTSPGTSTPPDCNATMPSGGTDHCGQNTQGSAGGQSWSLWSNANSSSGCITTFSTAAFSARWNNNSDFLARIGLEFGNASKTYDQYGTLKADLAFKKTGSAGGYSYIGIYGWTNNPCVEWYIVDDRFGTMPFNAYNATQKGTAQIDGADYKLFQNKTNGTGGSRCTGVSQWDQFWSIRQVARQCGTLTISDHFKAWEAAGLKMGGLLEAKILVETGGGSGSIEFPVAKVTAQ